jgi:hypothetical protein
VRAPPGVLGGEPYGPGCNLGLVDGRDRLGEARQAGEHPAKLRRIEPGELDHGHADAASGVQELTPDGLVEALDGVLGAAVRALQRDAR